MGGGGYLVHCLFIFAVAAAIIYNSFINELAHMQRGHGHIEHKAANNGEEKFLFLLQEK